ncbi:hypothetical protein [Streptomyces boninensis]|uniref:hypothetical protein n=1 Tax=Streptomyces boninensis TaxID=2039455 RepID=UPI003B21F5AE
MASASVVREALAVRELSAAEHRALVRTLRGAWPGLPALLCGSAAVCAAAVLVVLLTPGVTPLSALLASVLVTPAVAALAAVANSLSEEGEARIRGWWRELRRLFGYGAGHGLLAGLPVAAFLVALEVWRATGSAWALPSLGVSGAASAVAVLALGALLPLGARRPDLRGRHLWLCSVYLVARRPLRFLAGPAVAALGVWAAVHWTASLLLLVPGPAVLVAVAAVWSSVAAEAAQAGDDAVLGARPGHPGGDPG